MRIRAKTDNKKIIFEADHIYVQIPKGETWVISCMSIKNDKRAAKAIFHYIPDETTSDPPPTDKFRFPQVTALPAGAGDCGCVTPPGYFPLVFHGDTSLRFEDDSYVAGDKITVHIYYSRLVEDIDYEVKI